MELSPTEIERYSRQLLLPRWNAKLQLKLKGGTVWVPMTAALAARYFAGAGVGTIVLVGESSEGLMADLMALNPEILVLLEPGELRELRGKFQGPLQISVEICRSENGSSIRSVTDGGQREQYEFPGIDGASAEIVGALQMLRVVAAR